MDPTPGAGIMVNQPNVAVHDYAFIQTGVYLQGIWRNQAFQIYLNQRLVYQNYLNIATERYNCNNIYPYEAAELLTVVVPHSDPNITVVFQKDNQALSTNATFGLINLIGGRTTFVTEKSSLNNKTNYKGLNSNNLTEASLGAEGWSAYSPTATTKVTVCQGLVVAGGFCGFGNGAYLEKKFTFTGPHSPHFELSFNLYFVHAWSNETFYVIVDGVVIHTLSSNYQT